MPRLFRALRALWREIGSADASPLSRASRALEGNQLGRCLARFARFARFGRESARLVPRPIRALRALWKGISSADASPFRALRALWKECGSARASPFSRASRALDLQLRLIVCAQIKS